MPWRRPYVLGAAICLATCCTSSGPAKRRVPCRLPISPAVVDPGSDVSKLHPGHVRIVAAIGDSVTAGVGADQESRLPAEYRARSWSGGAGSEEHFTMPYMLGLYSANGSSGSPGIPSGVHSSSPGPALWGPATLKHPRPVYLFSWPFPYDFIGKGANLNLALSGAFSDNATTLELPELEKRLAGHFDAGAPGAADDAWKVVTVYFGENDVCGSWLPCGTPEEQASVVERYGRKMDALLARLTRMHKRIYINLMELFWVAAVAGVERRHPYCAAVERLFTECLCLHNVPGAKLRENEKKLNHVTAELNKKLALLARRYDRVGGRSDVGVNLVYGFNRDELDLSYLSRLDCFHPSAKTHSIAATRLWNGMLAVTTDRPSLKRAPELDCADEHSRFVTWNDREKSHEMWV